MRPPGRRRRSNLQDDVANLDEWQLAEGGSTNNSAAYDPFNTKRMTDSNNNPLPGVTSSNGFPAFATWDAGCTATVATLLQPNMAPIVSSLKAGNVSPPEDFLLDVDQSQWCAPSAIGIPCYASEILGGGDAVTVAQLLPGAKFPPRRCVHDPFEHEYCGDLLRPGRFGHGC